MDGCKQYIFITNKSKEYHISLNYYLNAFQAEKKDPLLVLSIGCCLLRMCVSSSNKLKTQRSENAMKSFAFLAEYRR